MPDAEGLTPDQLRFLNAIVGHLHDPMIPDESKAAGVSPTAVLVVTGMLHTRMGCTDPAPVYDDLEQMVSTCVRCERLAVGILHVAAILHRPRVAAVGGAQS